LNNDVEKELAELIKRKAELESSIAKLQNESGMEEEIRDKFQVSKKGEETLVILDEDDSDNKDNTENKQGIFSRLSRSAGDFWQSIKDLW